MKFSSATLMSAFAVSASAFTISMNSYLDSCGSNSFSLTSFANAPAPAPVTPIQPAASQPAAPYVSSFPDAPANSDLNYLASMGGGNAMKAGPNYLGMSKTFRQPTSAANVHNVGAIAASYGSPPEPSYSAAPTEPVQYGGLPQGGAAAPKGKYSMTSASWKTGSSPAVAPASYAPTEPVVVASSSAAVAYGGLPSAAPSMPKGKYSMTTASWKTSSPASAPVAFVDTSATPAGESVAYGGLPSAAPSMPKGKYSMTTASWKTGSPASAPVAFVDTSAAVASPPVAPEAAAAYGGLPQTAATMPKGKYSMTTASWKTGTAPAAAPASFAPASVSEPVAPVGGAAEYGGLPQTAASMPKGKYSMTTASWKTGTAPAVAPASFAPASLSEPVAPVGGAVEYGGLPQTAASMPKGKYSMTTASWKTGTAPAAAPASAFVDTTTPASSESAGGAVSYGGLPQTAPSMPKGKYSMTTASWKTSTPATAPAAAFVETSSSVVSEPAEAAVGYGGLPQAAPSMPRGKYSMTTASWKTSTPATAPAAAFVDTSSSVVSEPAEAAVGYGGLPQAAPSMPRGKYSMTTASWKTSSTPATAPAAAFVETSSSVVSEPAGAAVGYGGLPQAAPSMPRGKYSMTTASWKTSSPPVVAVPAAVAPSYTAPAAVGYSTPSPTVSAPKGKYSMTNASWKTSSPPVAEYSATEPAVVSPSYTAPAVVGYSSPSPAVSAPKGKYSMTNASWKASSTAASPSSFDAVNGDVNGAINGVNGYVNGDVNGAVNGDAPATPQYAASPAAEVPSALSNSYGAMRKSFAVASGKPRASTGMTNAGYLNAI